MSRDLLAADRVVVWVSALVATSKKKISVVSYSRSRKMIANVRELVVENVRHSSDVVGVDVHDTAGTETSSVVSGYEEQ